jgi:predicted nucleotidyltransferase
MPNVQLGAREQAALHDFVQRVRGALGANLVELRLFGSRARGDAAADSDIDVLVVVARDRVNAEDRAIDIGFSWVLSAPFARSSYFAELENASI